VCTRAGRWRHDRRARGRRARRRAAGRGAACLTGACVCARAASRRGERRRREPPPPACGTVPTAASQRSVRLCLVTPGVGFRSNVQFGAGFRGKGVTGGLGEVSSKGRWFAGLACTRPGVVRGRCSTSCGRRPAARLEPRPGCLAVARKQGPGPRRRNAPLKVEVADVAALERCRLVHCCCRRRPLPPPPAAVAAAPAAPGSPSRDPTSASAEGLAAASIGCGAAAAVAAASAAASTAPGASEDSLARAATSTPPAAAAGGGTPPLGDPSSPRPCAWW
jgi:hypothetical protein